jgi:hypothetical protein
MIRRAGLPGACTGLAATAAARLATALALLDSGHQFALAHPAGAGHAQGLGQPLQFRQQHAADSLAAPAPRTR